MYAVCGMLFVCLYMLPCAPPYLFLVRAGRARFLCCQTLGVPYNKVFVFGDGRMLYWTK